jgi:ribonuclease HI
MLQNDADATFLYPRFLLLEKVHGFASARFKSFQTRVEAEAFIQAERSLNGGTTSSSTMSTGRNSKAQSRKRSASMEHKDNAKASSGMQIIEQLRSPRKKQKTTSTTSTSNLPSVPSSPGSQVKIHIMFDGGSRGNPGIAGSGTFVTTTTWDDCKKSPPTAGQVSATSASASRVAERYVVKARQYVGPRCTNNEAEYNGLCTGLSIAWEQVQELMKSRKRKQDGFCLQLIVEGDSQLIIRQLTGVYACKNAKLKPMFAAAQVYVQEIRNLVLQESDNKNENNKNQPQSTIRVQYQHVLREGNSVADGT